MKHLLFQKHFLGFLIAIAFYLGAAENVDAQSKLWGMASQGGIQFGTIFSIAPGASALTDLFNLNGIPGNGTSNIKLVQANDGKLYGAAGGGTYNAGIIFRYDPSANIYTKMIDLSAPNGSGVAGSLLLASDGKFYGTGGGGANNAGVIFQYDPVNNIYTKKIDLSSSNGSGPNGTLIQVSDGTFYGMTERGGLNNEGVIFQYNSVTNIYTKKIDFSSSMGTLPSSSLMQASDSKLYGMTYSGGAKDSGVVFQYDPTTNIYTKKIDLSATSGYNPDGSLIQANDGKLYGMTYSGGANGVGVIFQYDPVTSTYTKKIDLSSSLGDYPYGSLMQANDGKLYGMTELGGANNAGVIFQYDQVANSFTKKIDLSTLNGIHPYGSLMQANDGKLYGTTGSGGIGNGGVIFQYDATTNNYAKKIDFSIAPDGANPSASLIYAADGKLYGMTPKGGLNEAGVLFQYDPVANTYVKKIDFASDSVSGASGSLMQASDGKLYGMTKYGGKTNQGVIFQYDPVTGIYTKKIDLTSGNGDYPYACSFMQANDGKLYGVTSSGGLSGRGVIFQYDPVSNIATKKFDFPDSAGYPSSTGDNPVGTLVQANDGKLYGMTEIGGAFGNGVIFQFDPVTNTYVKKIDLSQANGWAPTGSLLRAGDGKLYGMTGAGGAASGVIFQYDPLSNSYTKKIDFSDSIGCGPFGSLMQASDGKLYGMTQACGVNEIGVIFQYDPVSNTCKKMLDFNYANGQYPLYGNLVEVPLPITFNLKLYIQGYYLGSGLMTPVLKNELVSSNSNVVDTVTVSLVDTATLTVKRTATGVLQTNGALSVSFPGSVVGINYYIKINHRNAVETWSANTVTMSNGGLYDFTTGAAKAYGSNEAADGDGTYSFYSGDINQDGGIDGNDFLILYPDIQSGKGGYVATDINGDGGVDANDFLILYPNIKAGRGTLHP